MTDTEETRGRQFSSMFTAAAVTSKSINWLSPLFFKCQRSELKDPERAGSQTYSLLISEFDISSRIKK